ncbi:MAG: DedA family protein [bacterium]|jgi:membrane protein DedA with SNARE-associated domain
MFDFIVSVISSTRYIGVLLLMLLENIFPPIPSELIMPLAGYTAAQGQMSFMGVVLAGTIGSILGTLPWYYAGRFYKLRRLRKLVGKHGRWLTLTCSELDRAVDWFNRHGNKAVFVGRLVPAIRTLISVPAGLVRMNLFIFLLYSAIGSLLWTALLTWAGFILQSQYHNVEKYMNPLTNLVFIVIFAVYLYRLITYKNPDPETENSGT